MQLQELHRWHWAVVGVVAGLLLGVAYGFVYRDYNPDYRVWGRSDLLAQLIDLSRASDAETGQPVARRIVVHPLESSSARAQLVTWEMPRFSHRIDTSVVAGRAIRTSGDWERHKRWVELPYPAGTGPYADLREYLAAAGEEGLLEGVDVRYAWWREPLPRLAMFTLAGLVVMGGLWPTLLNLLILAGLVPPPRPKETFDLSRFGSEEEAAEAKRQMSDEERSQLEAVTAHLEEQTGGVTTEADGTGSPRTAAPGAPGPMKLPPPDDDDFPKPPPQEDEPKDYAGEYYPVARPHGSRATGDPPREGG